MFNELSYIYLTNIGYSKLFILLHSSLTMIDFFSITLCYSLLMRKIFKALSMENLVCLFFLDFSW